MITYQSNKERFIKALISNEIREMIVLKNNSNISEETNIFISKLTQVNNLKGVINL